MRSVRLAAGLIAMGLALSLFAAPGAWAAATPSVDIHSAGPLSDIYIGNDLSCQVRSGGFSSTEFFPNAAGPGDCGTFLALGTQLYGPNFANHPGGTKTQFPDGEPYSPLTPASQTLIGSGTAANPYRVSTTVNAGATGMSVTELDSYIAGNDYYETDITIANNTGSTQSALVFHAADCLLRGDDSGFGALAGTTAPACASNANNVPPSALEALVPLTAANNYVEATSSTVWGDVGSGTALPNSIDTNGDPVTGQPEDNAEAVQWRFLRVPTGQAETFSLRTQLVDTVPTGGFAFGGPAGSTVGGTVATITDPNTSATASAYSATINWGDGVTTPGTITGGNGSFNVTGNHAYTAGGTYSIAVTITSAGTSQGSSTVSDSAAITAPPAAVVTGNPPSIGGTTAAFTGSVDPNGLPTTVSFQYGLDRKYTGAGPLAFTQSTPAQAAGSDFASHTVSASVGSFVPNALYHVRLVATNSAGATVGPDVTFTTHKTAPPGAPTVGKTFNLSPVSGVVLILLHGQLVPLTELQQIPKNTLIDALHGTLNLTTALPGSGGGAHDAAANGKKPKKVRTQHGTFRGAIFKISQARNGLATLSLVEGALKGGPSFGTCKAHKAGNPSATAAASKTLQLLHASAKGKFSTRGRYSAATVRGTKWTVADRADGTLTHDITHSVAVTDFVRHKTIVLHAGQSYLAKKH